MDEQIVCFKREILSEYLNRSIAFRYDELLWHRILENLEVLLRFDAESDFRFKQLIVYTLIKSGDLYLTYKRTPKTGEKRLSEKYSLGIGGHVNIVDRSQLTYDKRGFILQALWREIKEEINIHSKALKEPEIICFINDDSDDVGKVHFGVTWLLEIKEPNVSGKGSRGIGIGKLEFRDIFYLRAKKDYFERWSQLLIDYLEERMDRKCHY